MHLQKFAGIVPHSSAIYIQDPRHWIFVTHLSIFVVESYNLNPIFTYSPKKWPMLVERAKYLRKAAAYITDDQNDYAELRNYAINFHLSFLSCVDNVETKYKDSSSHSPKKARIIGDTLFFSTELGDLFSISIRHKDDPAAVSSDLIEDYGTSMWDLVYSFTDSHVIDIDSDGTFLWAVTLSGQVLKISENGKILAKKNIFNNNFDKKTFSQKLAIDKRGIFIKNSNFTITALNFNLEIISENTCEFFEFFGFKDQEVIFSSFGKFRTFPDFDQHYTSHPYSPLLFDQEISVFSDGSTFRGDEQIASNQFFDVVESVVSPNRLFIVQASVTKQTHPTTRDLPDIRFVKYLALEELPMELDIDILYSELLIYVHLIGIKQANSFLIKNLNSKNVSPKLLFYLQKILSELNATNVEKIEIDEEKEDFFDIILKKLRNSQKFSKITKNLENSLKNIPKFYCEICDTEIHGEFCENQHEQIFDVFSGAPLDDPFYLTCKNCDSHAFSAYKQIFDDKVTCPLCRSTMRDCFE